MQITVEIPDTKATITVPDNLDENLLKVGFKAFLAGIYTLSKITDPDSKREALIRFIGVNIFMTVSLLKATQQTEKQINVSTKHIINQFLKRI
jgi:hypothetical protein